MGLIITIKMFSSIDFFPPNNLTFSITGNIHIYSFFLELSICNLFFNRKKNN